jgi:hypothetical protein
MSGSLADCSLMGNILAATQVLEMPGLAIRW